MLFVIESVNASCKTLSGVPDIHYWCRSLFKYPHGIFSPDSEISMLISHYRMKA